MKNQIPPTMAAIPAEIAIQRKDREPTMPTVEAAEAAVQPASTSVAKTPLGANSVGPSGPHFVGISSGR